MALPTERIAAGLAARETARSRAAPPPMALVPPGGRPVPRRTAADLTDQARKILETEREVKRVIAEATADMAAVTEQINARWASETAIPRATSEPVAREQARKARDEIRGAYRNMLEAIVRDCGASHLALVEQSPLQHSRAQALALVGLGTPERAALEQTAAKSGRVGLVTLGQEALALMADDDPAKRYHGTILASVLHLELGSRDPSDRPFAAQVLVEEAPLHEHEAASRAIRVGNSALTNISKLCTDFLAGRDNEPRSLARVMDDLDEAGGGAGEDD
jgi:hypothetical protein